MATIEVPFEFVKLHAENKSSLRDDIHDWCSTNLRQDHRLQVVVETKNIGRVRSYSRQAFMHFTSDRDATLFKVFWC